MFLPGEVAAQYGPSRYLTFEGFSVDEHGTQHFLDATVAYRQACLRAIDYLKRFGKLHAEYVPPGRLTRLGRLFRGAGVSASVMCPSEGHHCWNRGCP